MSFNSFLNFDMKKEKDLEKIYFFVEDKLIKKPLESFDLIKIKGYDYNTIFFPLLSEKIELFYI